MGRSGRRTETHRRAEVLLRHEVYLLLQKGRASLSRGRTAEAEEAFRKVIAIEPSHRAALTGLGEASLRRKDHAKACEYFEQAIAAGGVSEYLLYAVANACRGAQRREKAFKYFQQLVELNPSHVKGLTRLGEGHLERKEFGPATIVFRQALELDTHNGYALAGLAAALRGARDYRGAIEVYETLLRTTPNDHRTIVRLGEAYAHVGDPGSARRAFDLALRIDPENRYARDGLARLDA